MLDMAKPKYNESTTWLGRDAVRKSTLKVNILQVFPIDFSEIQFIVNHNSQSDGQNKSEKSGMNLHKKTIEEGCRSTALYSSSPRIRSTSSSVCKAGALVPSSSCLDGEPHGWVPVDTHSTPVLTSVRRLWVAYVLYEPNEPQEHAQPAHGSGARVQDHDPGASQPVQHSGTIDTGHGCCRTDTETVSRTAPPESASSEDDESSTPSMEQSEETAPATTVSNNNKALKRCWRMPRWSHPSVRRTQQPSCRATRLAPKTHW